MAEKKSKILIIGGTGYIGKFIVEASAKSGHPTFALVQGSTLSDPDNGEIVQKFRNLGVTFVYGDIFTHNSLLKAIKKVDVVISAVGFLQTMDQVNIIAAIKEAGNIKRFFPYEFGNDVDEPPKPAFEMKDQIRTKIEAAGIPFTYVVSNPFFDTGDDIATYIIRAVDDPRALNQVLYVRPPLNTELALANNEELETKLKSLKELHTESELQDLIRASNNEAQSQLRELESRFIASEQKNVKLIQQLNRLKLKSSESERDLKESSEKLSELKVGELESALDQSYLKYSELKDLIQASKKASEEAHSQHRKLRSHLNLLELKSSESERDLNESSEKLSELPTNLAEVDEEKRLLLDQLKEYEEKRLLLDQMKEYEVKVGELESALDQSSLKYSELKDLIQASKKAAEEAHSQPIKLQCDFIEYEFEELLDSTEAVSLQPESHARTVEDLTLQHSTTSELKSAAEARIADQQKNRCTQ